MSDAGIKPSELVALRSDWRKARPPLVIERGPNGNLRSTQLRIHEDDLQTVIGPDRRAKDLTDLLVAMGCEFIDKTGRYACSCQFYDACRREYVLWIEAGAIINPEVERIKELDRRGGAIDI